MTHGHEHDSGGRKAGYAHQCVADGICGSPQIGIFRGVGYDDESPVAVFDRRHPAVPYRALAADSALDLGSINIAAGHDDLVVVSSP